MPKATKYHFLIALTTFCLCLLTFILVDQNAWPQDKTQIQTLINKLKDSDAGVRQQAAEALGKIGPEAKVAVPILIEAFEDDNIMVRSTAVVALGAIGPGAIPALIEAFKDEDIRLFAALALAEIGPAAVPSLIEILKNKKNEHYLVRSTAVVALGYIGPESKATVPVLIEAVKDKDRWIRQPAANALERLATYLRDAKATDMIKQLKAAKKALSADPDFKNQGNTVRRAVEYLEQIKPPWWVRLKEWAFKNIVTSFLALAYLLWIIIWLIVFWLHPLALLRINQAFKQLEFSPSWAGGLKLPARVAFFIGFLNYHPRVLNAWVKAYIPAARENFKKGDTYKTRKTYVPLPVYMGEKLVDNLTVGELRSTCNKDRWCVLIQGEGGLGKTTIACQLALWAMADNPSARLCEHRLMLPVLIEPSIGFDVRQDMSAFHGELHGRFQRLVGSAERLPEELFEKLLRTRRILLIIDGLSEMPSIAEAPETVRPEHKDFPVNALIITSRTKEKVGADVTIFPSRIDRDHLIPFMNAYLIGAGHHLEDSALFQACGRLADMVVDAGRDITPLLAKLYIEELIASAKAGKLPRELPGNVPDLMLSYLNNLNRDRKTDDPDNPTVHFAAKTIAWACVQRSYQPSLASKEDIIGTIDAGQSSRNLLNYLEDRLQLIRTVSPEETKVQFLLDTLSEYLAALHLLDLYGEKEEDWKNFLSEADGKEGAPEAIKGFLLAVRDCIIAKGEEAKIPNFVADELAKRSGLDIEAIKRAQKEQRIQRLINQLGFAETYDRQQAAEALRNIGPAAKAAAPALIEALKDKDEDVRWQAAEALRNIGPAAKAAAPALIEALKDKDEDVRWQVAEALRNIGPEAKAAVPALIEALKDEDWLVRWQVAEALGEIGPDAKAAVPALIEALKDEEEAKIPSLVADKLAKRSGLDIEAIKRDIKRDQKEQRIQRLHLLNRRFAETYDRRPAGEAPGKIGTALRDDNSRRQAAEILGKIGPQAKPAVPALIEALKDRDGGVRCQAAWALGKIGPQAKTAVLALIEALKEDWLVCRYQAAEALGKIGPQAKPAVPDLIKALKDEDWLVRRHAAEALGKIGPEAQKALEEYNKQKSD